MDDRLSDFLLRRAVVVDPLDGPLDSLAPPVGIRVESAEIDVLESELGIKVSTVITIVEAVIGLAVVSALASPGNQMVGIEALDVCAEFVGPGSKKFRLAVRATGKVAGSVGATTGLVGEFPGHDCWALLVAVDDLLDVALEGLLDLRQTVEL